MLETRTVSLKTAIAIIVVCTAAFITLGISVGYAKYWDLDENAHLDSGRTYYRQGNKDRAQAEYKKALSLDKNNIEAMYNLGLVEKDMKNYKDAEFHLQGVLKINPSNELASYTLAQVYRESKQYNKASMQYLKALKLSPGSANIIAELGLVYEAQGKEAEAIDQYRDALSFVPDLEIAREGISRLGRQG